MLWLCRCNSRLPSVVALVGGGLLLQSMYLLLGGVFFNEQASPARG